MASLSTNAVPLNLTIQLLNQRNVSGEIIVITEFYITLTAGGCSKHFTYTAPFFLIPILWGRYRGDQLCPHLLGSVLVWEKSCVPGTSLVPGKLESLVTPGSYYYRVKNKNKKQMAGEMTCSFRFPKIHMLKPNPKYDSIRRWLGHEDGALINRISALIKEALERSLPPSAIWGRSEKMAI